MIDARKGQCVAAAPQGGGKIREGSVSLPARSRSLTILQWIYLGGSDAMLSDLPFAFIILAPCISGFAMILVVSVLAAGRA